MLINIVDPEDDSFSRPSEQEYRLLSQLTRIDQKLRSKMSSKTDAVPQVQWARKKEEDIFVQDKGYHGQEKASLPIYNANMEYFSQIGMEDIDDDSLFDPHNNILAAPKPHQESRHDNGHHLAKKVQKRKQSNDLSGKENQLRNSQSQSQFKSNSQIKKQISYAYKKDVQEYPKFGLPPKSSKLLDSKLSIVASTHQRNASGTMRLNGTTPQSLVARKPSKARYTQKEAIQEENKFDLDDPCQFKFHTFKGESQDNINDELEDKSTRKYTHSKRVEQDRVSLECTFKPNILKKSTEMAKSKKSIVERVTPGHTVKEVKKPYQPPNRQSLNRDRLDALSQPRRLKTQYEGKVEEVPSFRPSLSKKSLEQMSNCQYDVATRNELWQKQKEEKIERLRQQEEKQKERKQNCTHSPSLCQYKGENAPNLSRFGRQGIQNYFERVAATGKTYGKESSLKENRQSEANMSREAYTSKGFKKQKYEDAVKSLHSRIMNLKI